MAESAPSGGGEAAEPAGPLAPLVDHTALAPETSSADVERRCREAVRHGFAAVCVNPCYVELAAHRLEDREVAVATVVSFPLGQHAPDQKAREAEGAVAAGATELDMVANVGAMREGRWDVLREEVGAAARTVGERARLKVILETAVLEPREVLRAGRLAAASGADFLKTSTGFHPAGGATAEAVALLWTAGSGQVEVKAAGGIRTCEDALTMVASGASRIGTSSGLRLAGCEGPLPPPLGEFLADGG